MSANEMHSSGKPRKLVIGENTFAMISQAPEFVNIPTAVISRISIGRSSTAVLRFSAAPSQNVATISTFFKSPYTSIKTMSSGAKRLLKLTAITLSEVQGIDHSAADSHGYEGRENYCRGNIERFGGAVFKAHCGDSGGDKLYRGGVEHHEH